MAALKIATILIGISLICQQHCDGASVRNKGRTKNKIGPIVTEDLSWPGLVGLGQVSGISVDGDGNLHVFHRADRVWGPDSFRVDNQLKNKDEGPIKNDTMMIVDSTTGKVIDTWGADRFYMPHGLHIDGKGNTWTTDVGLHQIMKFPARETQPSLILGERFMPGRGKYNFCKPTSVAVTDRGYFFVSDGYCNSRIVMFSRTGMFMREIGVEDNMDVPHSLTLFPYYGVLCVADRENLRVLCYSSGIDGKAPGEPAGKFEGNGMKRIFAIAHHRNHLFAVNGPDLKTNEPGYGVIVDVGTGDAEGFWGPEKGFPFAHDLAISPDGKNVFVSEIDVPTSVKRVYKFQIQN